MRKKTVSNMSEVLETSSLSSLEIVKAEDVLLENIMLDHETGFNEDVVNLNIVLVEGIKCRSQLKCEGRPGGYVCPGCSVALGECKCRK